MLEPAHAWMKSGSQRPPVLGQAVGSCGQEMLSSTFASERGLRGGVLLSVTGLSCQTPARLAQTHLVSLPEVLCRARDLPRLVRMIRQTCPPMSISAHSTRGDNVHPVRGFMDIKAEGKLRKAENLS